MGERLNTCLHEAAHAVARQKLIGDLRVVAVTNKNDGYCYPTIRKPLRDIDPETLALIAVQTAVGVAAEDLLCSYRQIPKLMAVSDDLKQIRVISRLLGWDEAKVEAVMEDGWQFVKDHEPIIRKVATELNRRNKLSGEQLNRLLERIV